MEIPYYDTENCDVYCDECAPRRAQPNVFAESDIPQHCVDCGVMLDVSMTADGRAYTVKAVLDMLERGRDYYLTRRFDTGCYKNSPAFHIVRDWMNEYDIEDEKAKRALQWMEYQEAKEEK